MEVREKREALSNYCYGRRCDKCVFVDDNDFCAILGDNEGSVYDAFKSAPEEMVHKWHAIAFPEPVIKDSGERRQFYDASGKPIGVRDSGKGKGRMDLLPWAAIMEVSKHCENGLEKYPEHSVDKGLPTSSFCDSAARHLAKYLDGWQMNPTCWLRH